MFANMRAVRPVLQVGKVVGSAVDEKNSEEDFIGSPFLPRCCTA